MGFLKSESVIQSGKPVCQMAALMIVCDLFDEGKGRFADSYDTSEGILNWHWAAAAPRAVAVSAPLQVSGWDSQRATAVWERSAPGQEVAV